MARAVTVVESIRDCLLLERVDWDPEHTAYRITFRSTPYELSPEHRLVAWFEGEELPRAVEPVGYQENHWWFESPEGGPTCYATAVFHAVTRIGSRWKGKSGVDQLRELVRGTMRWAGTFKELLAWKAPLLEKSMVVVVQTRCLQEPLSSLVTLFAAIRSCPDTGSTQSLGPLLRELFREWTITEEIAAGVLQATAILPAHPHEIVVGDLEEFQRALAADAVLTSILVIQGLGKCFPNLPNHERSVLVGCLQRAALQPEKSTDVSARCRL